MNTSRTYVVPDITCDNCKTAINSALGAVPGVGHVDVDLAAKTVTVEGPAPEDAVRSAIDDAGFEVTGVVG